MLTSDAAGNPPLLKDIEDIVAGQQVRVGLGTVKSACDGTGRETFIEWPSKTRGRR